jgi:hypothetical protein
MLVVASLFENAIFSRSGLEIGEIRADGSVEVGGRRVGTFRSGRFFDSEGRIVGFVAGAVGQIASARALAPLQSIGCSSVLTPPSPGWSTLTWGQFVEPTDAMSPSGESAGMTASQPSVRAISEVEATKQNADEAKQVHL